MCSGSKYSEQHTHLNRPFYSKINMLIGNSAIWDIWKIHTFMFTVISNNSNDSHHHVIVVHICTHSYGSLKNYIGKPY